MNHKAKKKFKVVLGILIGIFVMMLSFLFIPFAHTFKQILFPLVAILSLVFFVLGIVLIIMTLKKKIKGKLKWFLLLTGASSALILPSVILHNVVYGLLIYLFGEGIWESIGMSDEAFFFIMAIFICPIVFLIGSVGSMTLLIRKK
ncbi:hypothetical protein ACFL6I_21475 [candidate division KSB1 bacterium]